MGYFDGRPKEDLLDKYDQTAFDDLVRRVGPTPILEALADHILFQSAKLRRKRDQAMNQEAKARYRLMGKKLENASNKLVEIAWKLKHIPTP